MLKAHQGKGCVRHIFPKRFSPAAVVFLFSGSFLSFVWSLHASYHFLWLPSWNLFPYSSYLTFLSEKAMAPHSSTLAWKIPWMVEPGRLQSMGSWRVGHDWATSLSISCIGEGSGTPLQCSCLENPRDGGAWWAALYGVAQSWTRLKWLNSSSSNNNIPIDLKSSLDGDPM